MSTSSHSASSPSIMPSSNLVSAMMIPRSAASAAPFSYTAREMSRAALATSTPTMSHASSNPMFSSWPLSALVEGVNTGWGSRVDCSRPLGSGWPCMVPDAWYSFQAEPDR